MKIVKTIEEVRNITSQWRAEGMSVGLVPVSYTHLEESGAHGHVIKYIGKTQYVFRGNDDMVNKSVHWYLMSADSFYCKPQSEEFFADAGFYKFHEAYHLLKFNDERQMLKRAFLEYADMKKAEGITPRNVILKGYNN